MNFTKIKWILGISLVFLLILATNLIDRKSYHQMKDTVENIYEDRLVAKNILFEISLLTQEKVLAIAQSDTAFFQTRNGKVNDRISELSDKYEECDLTPKEAEAFEVLQTNLEDLKGLESGYLQIEDPELKAEREAAMLKDLKKIEENFVTITEIQLEEGKRQMFVGKQAVESIELLNKMEFYLLVVLAVIVQIIVLYKRRTTKKAEN